MNRFKEFFGHFVFSEPRQPYAGEVPEAIRGIPVPTEDVERLPSVGLGRRVTRGPGWSYMAHGTFFYATPRGMLGPMGGDDYQFITKEQLEEIRRRYDGATHGYDRFLRDGGRSAGSTSGRARP